MDGDELWALAVPVRLLGQQRQINAGGQMRIELGDHGRLGVGFQVVVGDGHGLKLIADNGTRHIRSQRDLRHRCIMVPVCFSSRPDRLADYALKPNRGRRTLTAAPSMQNPRTIIAHDAGSGTNIEVTMSLKTMLSTAPPNPKIVTKLPNRSVG